MPFRFRWHISKQAWAGNEKAPASKKDCFACDYFPMCSFDVSKSYNNRLFHGTRNDDNSIVYYYCSNGEVIKRWEYTREVTKTEFLSGWNDDYIHTYTDYENKNASITVLKTNVPVGTTWTEEISPGGSKYQFMLEQGNQGCI